MDFGIILEVQASNSFDYEEMQEKVASYCQDNKLKSFLNLDFECQLFFDEVNSSNGLILMRYNYMDEDDEDLDETRDFVYENEETNVLLVVDYIKKLEGVSAVSILVEEM